MSERVLEWKGRILTTYRDIMDNGIAKCETPEEAREFMERYRAFTPSADENIGYLSGYYGPAEMARIQEWFGVSHPVFGRDTAVTPKDAFEAGRRWAAGECGPIRRAEERDER